MSDKHQASTPFPTREQRPEHRPLENTVAERRSLPSLLDGLRDSLFPPQLPPLELTSTPIPSPDRMAGRTNP